MRSPWLAPRHQCKFALLTGISETWVHPEQLADTAETRQILDRAISTLPTRHRHVVRLYDFEGWTMKQIGIRLGVDESRVSQIRAAALAWLQVQLAPPVPQTGMTQFYPTSFLSAWYSLHERLWVSYTIPQRTHEIGIRMALGAGRRDVLRVVVIEALLAVAGGLAVGLVASFGLTRVMSSLLYRVGSNDPLTLIVVSAILTVVAVLASHIPSRRATKVDPLVALRYE